MESERDVYNNTYISFADTTFTCTSCPRRDRVAGPKIPVFIKRDERVVSPCFSLPSLPPLPPSSHSPPSKSFFSGKPGGTAIIAFHQYSSGSDLVLAMYSYMVGYIAMASMLARQKTPNPILFHFFLSFSLSCLLSVRSILPRLEVGGAAVDSSTVQRVHKITCACLSCFPNIKHVVM